MTLDFPDEKNQILDGQEVERVAVMDSDLDAIAISVVN